MKKFFSLLVFLTFSVLCIMPSIAAPAVVVEDQAGGSESSYGEYYDNMLKSEDIMQSVPAQAQIYTMTELVNKFKGDVGAAVETLQQYAENPKELMNLYKENARAAEEAGFKGIFEYYSGLTKKDPEELLKNYKESLDRMAQSLRENGETYAKGIDKDTLEMMDKTFLAYNEKIGGENGEVEEDAGVPEKTPPTKGELKRSRWFAGN